MQTIKPTLPQPSRKLLQTACAINAKREASSTYLLLQKQTQFVADTLIHSPRSCRLCESTDLETVLKLTPTVRVTTCKATKPFPQFFNSLLDLTTSTLTYGITHALRLASSECICASRATKCRRKNISPPSELL